MGEFLSLNEILVLRGVSEATLRREIRRGRFPAPSHRKGLRHFWLAEDVRAAIAGQIQPIDK